MPVSLPPLNALRAFEAAGRHLSLTRAAEELHVTPAAVSHQIKALEAYLGVALFRRRNRALLLTDAGQACLPGLRQGFEHLSEAVDAARGQIANRPLCCVQSVSSAEDASLHHRPRSRQGVCHSYSRRQCSWSEQAFPGPHRKHQGCR